jgi:hypothetical protein
MHPRIPSAATLLLEQRSELRHQCFLLRKLDAAHMPSALAIAGHFVIMQCRRYFSISASMRIGIEQADRGARSVRKLCIALNRFAEALRDHRDPAYDPEPPKTVQALSESRPRCRRRVARMTIFQQRRFGQSDSTWFFRSKCSRYLGRRKV